MAEPTAPAHGSRRNYVEIIATILLAIAAVATAWSSYQANRWNGEQAKATSATNGLRVLAARSQGLAENQTQVDVATYIQWIDARATGNTELETFYRTRFRPEFVPAFDAWLATNPLTTPTAPLTPFAMPEYRLAATKEAERLDAATAVSVENVQRNIQRSGNYVLGVVLFAIAMFFAGITTKLTSARLRTVLLAVACVMFVATAVWIATFPVRMSI